MINELSEILVPIFICVVLPVAIVLIVMYAKINADNKRAATIMKAIECNPDLDATRIESLFSSEMPEKRERTPQEKLNRRLLRACIFSFGGAVLMLAGIVRVLLGACDVDEVFTSIVVGAISVAVGVSFFIVYRVSRQSLQDRPKDDADNHDSL